MASQKIAVVCGDITAALNRRPELMHSFAQLSSEKPLFVCPPHEKKYRDQIEDIGFRVEVVDVNKQSLNPMAMIALSKKISEILKDYQPDHVFTFHLMTILAAARSCRNLGCKCHCLFAGLGYIFSSENSIKRRLAEKVVSWLMKSNLRDAETVFFQNPDDRETIKGKGILASKSNVVLVNGSGVSLTRFEHSAPSSEGPVTFLLVSRILRDKGIPEYYEAAKRLKQKWGDQVRVQLLGPFDKNPNAMTPQQIQQWHDEGTIEYLGVTDDVRPYLKAMSVFTLPSFYMEGTPKTILESLAIGRAIITTTSRGCRETVEPGVNGLLIEPKNVDALYEAMEHFVVNRTAIAQMGLASNELAKSKYDVEKVNQHMLQEMGLENRQNQGPST